jgi:hypothetical protein
MHCALRGLPGLPCGVASGWPEFMHLRWHGIYNPRACSRPADLLFLLITRCSPGRLCAWFRRFSASSPSPKFQAALWRDLLQKSVNKKKVGRICNWMFNHKFFRGER